MTAHIHFIFTKNKKKDQTEKKKNFYKKKNNRHDLPEAYGFYLLAILLVLEQTSFVASCILPHLRFMLSSKSTLLEPEFLQFCPSSTFFIPELKELG